METREIAHISAAILLMFAVAGAAQIFTGNFILLPVTLLFSATIIIVNVFAKKLVAYWLDASVHHELWHFQQFGFRPIYKFTSPIPFGIIIPLLFSFITLGFLKVFTFLTYETSALKHRAAKRHGYYSYTEMTDWHNGWVGAAGIIALFVLSFVSYFPGWETLSKLAAYYAFWNMLPISKLDGTQIFFGSRILWAILAAIALIFALYAVFLPL